MNNGRDGEISTINTGKLNSKQTADVASLFTWTLNKSSGCCPSPTNTNVNFKVSVLKMVQSSNIKPYFTARSKLTIRHRALGGSSMKGNIFQVTATDLCSTKHLTSYLEVIHRRLLKANSMLASGFTLSCVQVSVLYKNIIMQNVQFTS